MKSLLFVFPPVSQISPTHPHYKNKQSRTERQQTLQIKISRKNASKPNCLTTVFGSEICMHWIFVNENHLQFRVLCESTVSSNKNLVLPPDEGDWFLLLLLVFFLIYFYLCWNGLRRSVYRVSIMYNSANGINISVRSFYHVNNIFFCLF